MYAGSSLRILCKFSAGNISCDPEEMTAKQLDTAHIACTLLVCCTQVDPKNGQANVPDELLACVEDPGKIGEYNWQGTFSLSPGELLKISKLICLLGRRHTPWEGAIFFYKLTSNSELIMYAICSDANQLSPTVFVVF